jgi:hypothetical protein
MKSFIQARSGSDCVGTMIDVTAPCVASDPPAYAEGLYGSGMERVGDAPPQDAYKPGASAMGFPHIQARSVSDGISRTLGCPHAAALTA